MALQRKLEAIKEEFREQAPAAVKKALKQAREELLASGRPEGALGEGQLAPDFTLADHQGMNVSSSSLREKGPLVVTFFRGFW